MIAIKTILVPTDLSRASVPAVGYATDLAQQLGAEVILLHVLPIEAMKKHITGGYGEGLAIPTEAGPGVQHQLDIDKFYEQKKQVLLAFVQQKVGADLRKGVKITPLVRLGKVVEETLAVAAEERCDLIVMASEGARLRHLFGGGITDRVVRHAPCPVLSMQPSAQIRLERDERLEVRLIDRWAA
jgi:universal stress protein A